MGRPRSQNALIAKGIALTKSDLEWLRITYGNKRSTSEAVRVAIWEAKLYRWHVGNGDVPRVPRTPKGLPNPPESDPKPAPLPFPDPDALIPPSDSEPVVILDDLLGDA